MKKLLVLGLLLLAFTVFSYADIVTVSATNYDTVIAALTEGQETQIDFSDTITGDQAMEVMNIIGSVVRTRTHYGNMYESIKALNFIVDAKGYRPMEVIEK